MSFESSYVTGVGSEVIWFLSGVISVLFVIGIYYCFKRKPTSSETDATEANISFGRIRSNDENSDCSICLSPLRFAIETNCGHLYCGACLMEFYQRLTIISTPNCPYCRQRLTVMLPYFSAEESRDDLEDSVKLERTRLLDKIKDYNRHHSDVSRSLIEQIRDLPVLCRRLWNILWSDTDRLHFVFRIRIFLMSLFVLIYVVIPHDFVPYFIYGIFGFIDDIMVILFMAMYAASLYRNIVAQYGQE